MKKLIHTLSNKKNPDHSASKMFRSSSLPPEHDRPKRLSGAITPSEFDELLHPCKDSGRSIISTTFNARDQKNLQAEPSKAKMYVVKRNGSRERVTFDKIAQRLETLAKTPFATYGASSWSSTRTYVIDDDLLATGGELRYADPVRVAQKVCAALVDGITTEELDNEAPKQAAHMQSTHPEYGVLASRIEVSNIHKITPPTFAGAVRLLKERLDPDFFDLVTNTELSHILEEAIDYKKDYCYDYFGICTLQNTYLLKDREGKIVERPQHMLMRIALWMQMRPDGTVDVPAVLEAYRLMSERFYTHATPTIFNAGTKMPQLASCFVAGTKVFTTDEPKAIETVKIGDMVVTHKGRIRQVSQLHHTATGDRKILALKTSGSPMIHVTDNHKFLAIHEEDKPAWRTVHDLKVGDYIQLPNYRGNNQPEAIDVEAVIREALGEYAGEKDHCRYGPNASLWYTQVSVRTGADDMLFLDPGRARLRTHAFPSSFRFIEVTKTFCKVLGLWLADGYVLKGREKKEGKMCYAGIGFNTNSSVVHYVRRVGAKMFGLLSKTRDDHVEFCSGTLGVVFEHLFGGVSSSKKLPASVNGWPNEHIRALMEGLVMSSGRVQQIGGVALQLPNGNLISQLFHLLRARGVGVFVSSNRAHSYMTKHGEEIIVPTHVLRLPSGFLKVGKSTTIRTDAENDTAYPTILDATGHSLQRYGSTFIKVVYLHKTERKDPFVYNLRVAEDHSYMVEGVVASNCFLLGKLGTRAQDSVTGMYETVAHMASISKLAGRIGVHMHEIRAAGAYIHGTGGKSSGLIPYLRVVNCTARHIDQAGVRPGAFAVFLEPWHADVEDFLGIRMNTGTEDKRARDLFSALWVPDLFFRRILEDGPWSLFYPSEAPGLSDVFDEEFDALYASYEEQGRARKVIRARDLWEKVLRSIIETGTPYISAKDAVNRKSNQKNLGTIKSSNLCNGVTLFSNPAETAVCTLASVALSKFVKYDDGEKEPVRPSATGRSNDRYFDFEELHSVVKTVTKVLDRVVDRTMYPQPECERSNRRHRPLGLGVQGFADVLYALHISFESAEAKELNVCIFERMYHVAIEASAELAELYGPYDSFQGSPASKGLLQFDLWKVEPSDQSAYPSYDWAQLKEKIKSVGLRNSTLIALMPTASTSQLLQNTESFEIPTSMLYSRRTKAGQHIVLNRWLVRELLERGMWSVLLKDKILANGGSVQNVDGLDERLKEIFKTTWEVKMKSYIDLSTQRGPFVCQSASMNLYQEDPSEDKLNRMLIYGWQMGLKTIMYYLRTKSASEATQFTVAVDRKSKLGDPVIACSLENPDCLSCSA
jgi:ribonucleoside-diphosphate reductase alpha subunit